MCDLLSDQVLPFGYADDVSLWYELQKNQSARNLVDNINADMEQLKRWGDDNNTTFEKTKMELIVVSQKRNPVKPTGITFDGFSIPKRKQIKLVGYTIDSRLRWGPMIDRLAKKARSRIGALSRVRCFLDANNMKLIYSSFIRSIMEYGSVAWMGAAVTHLNKLDRVQDTAHRIGNFRVESLNCRREASAAAFALKMMSGSCKGALNEHVPVTYLPQNTSKRTSRHTLQGLQIKPVTNTKSLNTFRHVFLGALPLI